MLTIQLQKSILSDFCGLFGGEISVEWLLSKSAGIPAFWQNGVRWIFEKAALMIPQPGGI